MITKDIKHKFETVYIVWLVDLRSNAKPKKFPVNIFSVQKQNRVNKNNLFGRLKNTIANNIATTIESALPKVEKRLFSTIQIKKKIMACIILLTIY